MSKFSECVLRNATVYFTGALNKHKNTCLEGELCCLLKVSFVSLHMNAFRIKQYGISPLQAVPAFYLG